MIKVILFSAFMMATFNLNAQVLVNKLDSVSYAIGTMIFTNMKQQGIKEVNSKVILKAIEDGMNGKVVAMTPDEASICLRNYITELNEKENEILITEGKNFLIENAKRPEIVQLPSGLQYEIVTSGGVENPSPILTDKVLAHYEGSLINGEVFDSSYERGEPYSLPVNGVIKGWQEALQLMKVGDKWKLYIPYELGYGSRGAGSSIPPFSTLVFDLELISIE